LKVGWIVFAAAYLFLLGPGLAADKVDLLGVSIGMSFDDVKKLAQAKDWSSLAKYSVYRTKESQKITLQFSPALPNQPLISMKLEFSTDEPDDNVVASLSEQFGAPTWQDSGYARWILRDGSELSLGKHRIGNTRTLDMSNHMLLNASGRATREQAADKNPMPKF
jgi:hypothetical protein